MTDDIVKQADDEFSAGFDDAETTLTASADDVQQEVNEPESEPQDTQPEQTDDTADANTDAPAPEEKPPWEAMPEEFRGQVRDVYQRAANFEHSFRSEQQRAIAQQKRAEQFEARIKELEGSAAQSETSAHGPTDTDMQALDESLPEVANIFRELRQQNEQLRAELERRVTPVEDSTQRATIDRETAALEAAHPDYITVATSAGFQAAMATAPPMIRRAFEQNAVDIVNHADAAVVIDWYKSRNGAAPQTSPPKQTQAGPTVQQRRNAKLESAVAPTVRDSAPPKTDDGADDFDAGFASADREIRQGRF